MAISSHKLVVLVPNTSYKNVFEICLLIHASFITKNLYYRYFLKVLSVYDIDSLLKNMHL